MPSCRAARRQPDSIMAEMKQTPRITPATPRKLEKASPHQQLDDNIVMKVKVSPGSSQAAPTAPLSLSWR